MQNQNQIYELFLKGSKLLIVLIDPDKFNAESAKAFFGHPACGADAIFVGGSLLSANRTEAVVDTLKQMSSLPVIIFPGNSMQVVPNADAILFLSLVSGRNAEFLIGQHVHAAPLICRTNLEVIPTAYILVDGGSFTSVQYISQSLPVPADKPDIAVATALAGKYLGQKLVYLEAGSGAKNAVPEAMVQQVADKTQLPVIVGGGIRDAATAMAILKAGATAVVVGTLFEQNPAELARMAEQIKSL